LQPNFGFPSLGVRIEEVAKKRFVCQECGYQSPKWLGRCPSCGTWESLVEEVSSPFSPKGKKTPPLPLSAVSVTETPRLSTGLQELDRVLGGGIVPGSLVLIGGDPGIGKSTLLLQIARHLAEEHPVLYLSGEESPQQIKLRAERLGTQPEKLFVLAETNLNQGLEAAETLKPSLFVVDSIQTVYLEEVTSAPGSVAQVRECAARLLRLAKKKGIATFLVGHVTKEGLLAGPRVLEHLVDTVLYFEGDRGANYRILRAVKNRFGSTNEIGVFEMQPRGLKPVENPSALFLSQASTSQPGAVILATVEGTRPILVEVQALVAGTPLAVPRRTSVGYDPQRLSMMAAILEKRLGLSFYDRDIYLNVVGGLRLSEPGADLAVATALVSSRLEKTLPPGLFLFGEVGLTGEVRPVSHAEQRIKEALRLGFDVVCLPQGNVSQMFPIKFIEISNLQELLEGLFR